MLQVPIFRGSTKRSFYVDSFQIYFDFGKDSLALSILHIFSKEATKSEKTLFLLFTWFKFQRAGKWEVALQLFFFLAVLFNCILNFGFNLYN